MDETDVEVITVYTLAVDGVIGPVFFKGDISVNIGQRILTLGWIFITSS